MEESCFCIDIDLKPIMIHSNKDLRKDVKINPFFENKIILKHFFEYWPYDHSNLPYNVIDRRSMQKLFRYIRERKFNTEDIILSEESKRSKKISSKKHRNCLNQTHDYFCYIEFLDAQIMLLKNFSLLHLETLQKLV